MAIAAAISVIHEKTIPMLELHLRNVKTSEYVIPSRYTKMLTLCSRSCRRTRVVVTEDVSLPASWQSSGRPECVAGARDTQRTEEQKDSRVADITQ
jgi:hypothetical protein